MAKKKSTDSAPPLFTTGIPYGGNLGTHATRLKSLIAEKKYEKAYNLLHGNLLFAWYSLEQHEFFEACQKLIAAGLDKKGTLRLFITFMDTLSTNKEPTLMFQKQTIKFGTETKYFAPFLRMLVYRHAGHLKSATAEAVKVATATKPEIRFTNNSFGDTLYVLLELGNTHLLAGDFSKAATYFTTAKLHPMNSYLPFLTRQAILKTALIEVVFGDLTAAKNLLKKTKNFPRSASWCESHLDAFEEVIETYVLKDPNEALNLLQSVPLNQLGEEWPAYLFSMFKTLYRLEKFNELDFLLEQYQSLPLPRHQNEGIPGSIVPLLQAFKASKTGNYLKARQLLDQIDHTIPVMALVLASIHLSMGNAALAKKMVLDLWKQTHHLRRFELWRLSVLSYALLKLDELDACENLLRQTLTQTHNFGSFEASLFPKQVREFAAQKIAEWPSTKQSAKLTLFGKSPIENSLSEREVEILQLLSTGCSRAEVAETLFLSLNTVKTHIRNIYKKFNVNNRIDAIITAQQRGIL